eukprot:CAMPEP_0173378520 /NCGR_PEP_ID=MMETSP1356-20130122/1664_1 /TAXON_ID=77927 ORGANISM="Hemiselmis virescens, Strain PCC157" /NCGR_SAMPLE_ID=MMETSP1356 /ASSEMBLY_ACC=CAM_ASM_000847 /LENGTH=241 /DNA_ID=CAMNT_0014331607 /DNA_START=19 /DNA_END=744 /DNA_ORIENTATION=+
MAKGPVVPEHVLKKRKTLEAIQADRSKKLAEERAKNKVQRGVIFKKAAAYAKEYKQKEADLVRFRREAKKHNNFFMEPETKVVFVIRIRGINAVDPKTRKILQLMRLRQINNGVFMKINSASINMLRLVAPYVTYGAPNLKTVRELIYKRGFGNVSRQRIPLSDNKVVEGVLGEKGIVCVEDLIHEIMTVGPAFREANKFLWPFKLSAPKGGLPVKRKSFVQGGQFGDRERYINNLVRRMN